MMRSVDHQNSTKKIVAHLKKNDKRGAYRSFKVTRFTATETTVVEIVPAAWDGTTKFIVLTFMEGTLVPSFSCLIREYDPKATRGDSGMVFSYSGGVEDIVMQDYKDEVDSDSDYAHLSFRQLRYDRESHYEVVVA